MGLCVALENETGETLTILADEKNFFHKVLPGPDDPSHPMLSSIDWYGDTVFNRIQMSRFLSEWESLLENAKSSEERKLLMGVKELAERCRDGVHLYVKFIGD
jgi:hypothetical protein